MRSSALKRRLTLLFATVLAATGLTALTSAPASADECFGDSGVFGCGNIKNRANLAILIGNVWCFDRGSYEDVNGYPGDTACNGGPVAELHPEEFGDMHFRDVDMFRAYKGCITRGTRGTVGFEYNLWYDQSRWFKISGGAGEFVTIMSIRCGGPGPSPYHGGGHNPPIDPDDPDPDSGGGTDDPSGPGMYPTLPTDFDGDGRSDIAIWRPSSGEWFTIGSANNSHPPATRFGQPGDIPVPGDYNGDGRADFAVFRPSTAQWWVNNGQPPTTFGNGGYSGDIPVPGDYNGDGRTDFAIWRPSTAQWWVNNGQPPTTFGNGGNSGDIPVPGDYNGDGRTDFAIWRPSTAQWWVNNGQPPTTFGNGSYSGDIPVPGDYTGDGRTDFAIWRPSTAQWWVNDGKPPVTYGNGSNSGDIPLVGNYLGDRRTDISIWRPSNGVWYRLGLTDEQWGRSDDIPLSGRVLR